MRRRERDVGEVDRMTGEVKTLRHHGNDFFGVAQVLATDGSLVNVVGKFVAVRVGDTVTAEGEWSEHPKFGRQFRMRALSTRAPVSAAGVVSWFAARLPKVGRARATALVERYGVEGIWRILDETPERLVEVSGITAEAAQEIGRVYREHRAERDREVFFRGLGLTGYQVAQVTSAWGARAEERIRTDPYDLAAEVTGFGFLRADQVAQRLGVARDHPGRIRAGLVHVLEEARAQGHAYVPSGKLVALAADLLRLPTPLVATGLPGIYSSRAIARGPAVYLRSLDEAEEAVVRGMIGLLRPERHGAKASGEAA